MIMVTDGQIAITYIIVTIVSWGFAAMMLKKSS